MKKILFTCFLGMLCLFLKAKSKVPIPRLERLIERTTGKNYLPDRGGVVSISLFLFVFLVVQVQALTVLSKVAESPNTSTGAGLLHRFDGSHRGGEARSDTIYSSSAMEIDGGPFLLQQKGSSLVDNSISLGQGSESSPAVGNILIYGEISDYGDVGEVSLQFWRVLFDPKLQNPGPEVHRMVPARSNIFRTFIPAFDRQFLFRLQEVSSPGFIRLELENNRFLDTYLAMPGDSIMVRVDRISNATVFTGPSASRYRCQLELENLSLQKELEKPKTFQLGPKGELSSTQKVLMNSSELIFGRKSKPVPFGQGTLDELWSNSTGDSDADLLAVLDRYRKAIGEESYFILKAEYLSKERFRTAYIFYKYAYPMALKHGDEQLVQRYKAFFRERLAHLGDFMEYQKEMLHSPGYVRLRNAILLAEAMVSGEDYLSLVQQVSDPDLCSKMVTAHFLDKATGLKAGDEGIKQALTLVQEEPYRGVLTRHAARHLTGSEVPEFTLENPSGEKIRLADFHGKAVLLDFYLSGCKACLAFHKEMGKIAEKFEDREDVVILSISVDRDREVWEKSLASRRYSVPGSLDLYTEGQGHEHALTSFYGISLVPHLMVIAPDGKLLKSGFYPMTYDRIFPELSSLLDESASTFKSASIQPSKNPLP